VFDQAKFHFLDGLWVTPAELPAASAGVHTRAGRFWVFRWGGVPEVCENLLYTDQEGPRIRIGCSFRPHLPQVA
jgi:hypothetical protein